MKLCFQGFPPEWGDDRFYMVFEEMSPDFENYENRQNISHEGGVHPDRMKYILKLHIVQSRWAQLYIVRNLHNVRSTINVCSLNHVLAHFAYCFVFLISCRHHTIV